MMDPEIKAKWVAALRDPNKYQQGHGRLLTYQDGNGDLLPPEQRTHCCLGVLAQEENIPKYRWKDKNLLSDVYLQGGEHDPVNEPSLDALNAYGIPEVVESVLACMNDGSGDHQIHTFAEIADFIEQHPEL